MSHAEQVWTQTFMLSAALSSTQNQGSVSVLWFRNTTCSLYLLLYLLSSTSPSHRNINAPLFGLSLFFISPGLQSKWEADISDPNWFHELTSALVQFKPSSQSPCATSMAAASTTKISWRLREYTLFFQVAKRWYKRSTQETSTGLWWVFFLSWTAWIHQQIIFHTNLKWKIL